MSVMVVSDKHLSIITNAIFHVALDGKNPHFLLDFCNLEGMDEDQKVAFFKYFEEEHSFIQELSRLNQLAYARDTGEPVSLWRPSFTPDPMLTGDLSWPESTTRARRRLLQAFKYIRCWLYQVSGYASQKAIYKFVEHVGRELSHELLMRSNEYEELQWSC